MRRRSVLWLLAVVLLLVGAARADAAFTFVAKAGAAVDVDSDPISVQLTGIQAGDLIAACVKHEGADTTRSISDGTSTLTAAPTTEQNHSGGEPHSECFYLLSSVATGSPTYTLTLGGNREYKRMVVYAYRYTGTASFDTSNSGQGTGTAIASGAITTTGTDEVVFGFYGEYTTATLSSVNINGSAADQTQTAGAASSAMWSRVFTGTFSSGQATATASASDRWTSAVMAFKASGGGGGATPTPRLMLLGVGGDN